MAIYALGDVEPNISTTAYIHPDAVVIGNVSIAEQASIWPCAVLRGDTWTIEIGARTSIQDGTIVHTAPGAPTIVGEDCVVGHNVHLEGCTIESRCLIGSGALLLHGVIVRHDAIVAAGAVLREKMEVESGTLVAGVPAVPKGPISAGFDARIARSVKNYIANAERFAKELRRID